MNSAVCPICERTFERYHKQKYCCEECYIIAMQLRRNERNRLQSNQKRWDWAMEQAQELYRIAHGDEPVEILNNLAKFVYNNYKIRRR